MEKIAYYQERVMRHGHGEGGEVAVHEVLFGEDDSVLGYTEDAVSPRAASVEELAAVLKGLLETEGDEVVCGDLNYTYDKVDIQNWLSCLAHPALDYAED